MINPLFLLTAKPVVYLINLSEKDYLRQKNKYLPKAAEWIKTNSPGDPIIPISASFEERLAQIGDDAKAEEECKQLNTKSGLPKVITTMRQSLNLASFFTTGSDEVRQWTIRKGIKAPAAAGVIHSGEFSCISEFLALRILAFTDFFYVQTLKRPLSRLLYTITTRLGNTEMKHLSKLMEKL